MKEKQNWLVFTQIGLQMALTIGLGTWAGYWIDGKMANKNPIAMGAKISVIMSSTFIHSSLMTNNQLRNEYPISEITRHSKKGRKI